MTGGIEPILTPWSVLTATAGLIAFHIGLYTLVGRERKSPYVINSVFPIFLLCLLVASVAVCSVLLPENAGKISLWFSQAGLGFAFLYSALIVYRIAVRFIYFVDTLSLKHLPGISAIRRWWTMQNPRPTYAHNTIPIPVELKNEILKIFSRLENGSWDNREELESLSLAVAVEHQGQGNLLLAKLATAFLKRGYSVQYLTASRHPIEFIAYLREHAQKESMEWQKITPFIVVIDAYSPHFAFTDTIYVVKTRELEGLDITCISSRMTYAGMHSASTRAFKTIQKQLGKQKKREPTLVIYEDTYALTDLESPELYRIFVRHVMPSERMWGGMFTVFIEAAQDESDWKLLQAYASMRLDLRSDSNRKPGSAEDQPKEK